MKNKMMTVSLALLCCITACNENSNKMVSSDKSDTAVIVKEMHGTMSNATMDTMNMLNPMKQSMMITMGAMDTLQMTGDIDLDFANSMIIHHQAAIDMSELEVAKAGNVEIIAMAKKIMFAQKAEIAQMKNFVGTHTLTVTNAAAEKKQNGFVEDMKTMMEQMTNMKLLGNTDDDYVMLMIPHHGAAIQMAKDEMAYGKEPAMKKMAAKMIADQTAEIDQFVAWSTKLK